MNKVIMYGNIKTQPIVKDFDYGSMCSFTLETLSTWRDKKTNELMSKSDKHRVVLMDPEHISEAQQLSENESIFIEGKLQTRNYKDKMGKDNYITEVVVPKAIGTFKVMSLSQAAKPKQATFRNEMALKSSGVRKAPPQTNFTIDDEIPF